MTVEQLSAVLWVQGKMFMQRTNKALLGQAIERAYAPCSIDEEAGVCLEAPKKPESASARSLGTFREGRPDKFTAVSTGFVSSPRTCQFTPMSRLATLLGAGREVVTTPKEGHLS